ncbi:MAG: Lrp/AsnC family transcriptional regulator [Ignavibacteria bacterium]|nr:Lrp/AsnC family transcriptional regulator [Ignavibacteria bacterium]MCU7504311.1 Lrp/AsnC family transcriptional regulator [Ignavibacteria bacterium]MCU7516156.1 Lrp/AsnC family transcriptional regulator [Ignavibacteria bacterium]
MLDDLDLRILRALQKNGRMKRSALAEHIGLSIPSVSERLNKLEENGVIEGYYARLNRKAFGFDIMAFIVVVMESSKHYKELRSNVEKIPQILECYSALGEGSHILKVVVRDSDSLEKLLTQIQSWPGVTRTVTSFILSTIKETSVLDI